MSAIAAMLDVIIAKAPELRAAGALRVEIDGVVKFELAPLVPQLEDSDEEPDDYVMDAPDALDDPHTFGGPVPGFRRREHEEHRR